MTLEKITYNELREAILISYNGDSEIFDMYDPLATVKSVEEIADDILRKVNEYGDVKIMGVYVNGKLVGYLVYRDEMLISFAISKKYRKSRVLKNFFSLIKKNMPESFTCHLWSKNKRAIKWLEKNGMQKVSDNYLITKLICQ